MLLKFTSRLLITTAFCILTQDLCATDTNNQEVVEKKVAAAANDASSFKSEFQNCLRDASTSKNPLRLMSFLRNRADHGDAKAQETLHKYLTKPTVSQFIGLVLTPSELQEAETRYFKELNAQSEWAVTLLKSQDMWAIKCLKTKSKKAAENFLEKCSKVNIKKIQSAVREYVDEWDFVRDPQPFIEILLLLNLKKDKNLTDTLEGVFLEKTLLYCTRLTTILHREPEGKIIERIAKTHSSRTTGLYNEKSISYIELAAHLQRRIQLIHEAFSEISSHKKSIPSHAKRELALCLRGAELFDIKSIGYAGNLLEHGFDGQPSDKKQALELYLKAAQLGDTKAMHNAGVLLEAGFAGQPADKKQALQLYLKAAQLGMPQAMFNAGALLHNGFDGQPSDKKQALNLYLKAAALGDEEAMFNAGALLHNGFDAQPSDMKQALNLYLKAAKSGHAEAMCAAGFLLAAGFDGQAPDKRRALELSLKAAQLGIPQAMFNAGVLLEAGFDGQASDKKRTLELFLKAAKSGHAEAMFNAGFLLVDGFDGQPSDKKQALELYLKAAQLGDAKAMQNAGVLLEAGFDGQASDKKQALNLYLKATALEYAGAMCNAGVLLTTGFDGQPVDKRQALDFFLKAAELGDARAMFNAGVMLTAGFDGQPVDKRQALDFFLKAAELGDARAMFNAGVMLKDGFEGQTADKKLALQEAEKYFRMAIDKGLHQAKLALAFYMPADTEENKQEKERLFKDAISNNVKHAQLLYANFLSQINRHEESMQHSEVLEEELFDDDKEDEAYDKYNNIDNDNNIDIRSTKVSSDDHNGSSTTPIPSVNRAPIMEEPATRPVKISKADKKLRKALERAAARTTALIMMSSDKDKYSQRTYKNVEVLCAPDAMKNITPAAELKIKGFITALANGEKRAQFHDLKGYDNTYAMRITKGDRFVFEILEGDMEKGVKKIRILIAKTHYTKLENKQTFPSTSSPVEWSE